MAAHYSKKDLADIVRLKDIEGLTHKEIALRLGRPNARAVMNQYKKAKAAGVVSSFMEDSGAVQISPKEDKVVLPDKMDQLNELSRKQRVVYLRHRMLTGAKNKHTFNNILDDAEREIFMEEYFNILQEEDSLTAAEEQQLFNAILHLTLAFRAAAQDKQCYLNSPMSGNPGATSPYIDVFKSEHHDQMKKYGDTMKGLKLSRAQRLQDLQRHGTSFLDFAEVFVRGDEQAKAADEIMRIEEFSEIELKKLQANGWLIGGGLPDNNPPSFDGDRTVAKEDTHDQDKQAAFVGEEPDDAHI